MFVQVTIFCPMALFSAPVKEIVGLLCSLNVGSGLINCFTWHWSRNRLKGRSFWTVLVGMIGLCAVSSIYLSPLMTRLKVSLKIQHLISRRSCWPEARVD